MIGCAGDEYERDRCAGYMALEVDASRVIGVKNAAALARRTISIRSTMISHSVAPDGLPFVPEHRWDTSTKTVTAQGYAPTEVALVPRKEVSSLKPGPDRDPQSRTSSWQGSKPRGRDNVIRSPLIERWEHSGRSKRRIIQRSSVLRMLVISANLWTITSRAQVRALAHLTAPTSKPIANMCWKCQIRQLQVLLRRKQVRSCTPRTKGVQQQARRLRKTKSWQSGKNAWRRRRSAVRSLRSSQSCREAHRRRIRYHPVLRPNH